MIIFNIDELGHIHCSVKLAAPELLSHPFLYLHTKVCTSISGNPSSFNDRISP